MTEQTQKVKRIVPGDGLSLDSLDVEEGDLVGFYDTIGRGSRYFVLAEVGDGKLRTSGERRLGEIMIHLWEWREFFLHTPKGILFLYKPSEQYREIRIPYISHKTVDDIDRGQCSYFISRSVYAGEEEILQALKERADLGLDFYVPWLESEFERMRDRR